MVPSSGRRESKVDGVDAPRPGPPYRCAEAPLGRPRYGPAVTPFPVPATPGRTRPRRSAGAFLALVSVLLVAACAGAGPSFDPAGPCVVDGQVAGAYPDLERRLPAELDGAAPTTVDSGRTCSADGLGSLAARDLAEVTFAGATWDLGDGNGVSSVVFANPDGALPAAWIAEFYETGARAARKTSNVETSKVDVHGGGERWRLDALNDLSFQTVVTWQDGDFVRVVLVATKVGPDASRADHDKLVEKAIGATGSLGN